MRIVPLLLVAASSVLSPVWGWVSRIELGSKKGKLSFSGLKAMEDDEMDFEAYRAQLETRFNDYGNHAHDFFSDVSPVIDNNEDWMDSEWSNESKMPCGEDCEVRYERYRFGNCCRTIVT